MLRMVNQLTFKIMIKGISIMMIAKMKAAKLVKGVGIGLAIGGAVGLAGGAVMQQPSMQRNAKKGINKALKTVSNVLDAMM